MCATCLKELLVFGHMDAKAFPLKLYLPMGSSKQQGAYYFFDIRTHSQQFYWGHVFPKLKGGAPNTTTMDQGPSTHTQIAPTQAQLQSPEQPFFCKGWWSICKLPILVSRPKTVQPKTVRPKTLQPKTQNPTTSNLWARLSVCQVVFNVGQKIFAAADCRPNKKPNPIMAEELACSMCFIVKQQSLDIISDVGEPEGAVPDHFVIKRHHNGRAAEAVEALVWGVLDLFVLE